MQTVIAESCDEIERGPLASNDSILLGHERIAWTNDGESPRDYCLIADGYNFDAYGLITVSVAISLE